MTSLYDALFDDIPINAGRFRCEQGQVYLITDTKTDVQYLAWSDFRRGGVCVLVDLDGKPILAGDEE